MMNRKVTLLPLILLAGGALVLAGCDGGGASSTTSVGGTSSTGTSEAPTIDPDPSTPYMDEIVSGETYHLGIYQQTLQKYIWYNGQMSGYYFATADNYDDGVEVLATAVDGVDNGYTLQVGSAYIAAKASGTHNNIIVSPTAFTWTWNTDGDYFSGMCGDREVYMGNYGTYNTVSLSTMDHLDGEDTNLARLFDREPGPVEIEEDPRNTPLTTITSGTQYHIGLYNEQLYQQLYFTGDLKNDYYGATSRDIADAATVVPTTSGDGYTLKIVGGANDGKYIGYTYSTSTNDEGEVSEHNTFVITDDPFVWTVTSEGYITGIAEGRTEVYFMGSNGTFDTISMYPQNELSNTTTYYPVRFYEHETDPQPIPEPEAMKLADAMNSADDTVVTTRGVYMGKSDVARSDRWNYVWVADGDAAGALYSVNPGLVDDSWVAGETVLEIEGTKTSHSGLQQIGNVTALTVVEDASVTAGTITPITGQELTAADVSHSFRFTDATVKEINKDNYGTATITATVSNRDYTLRLDNRDVAATNPLMSATAGDTFSVTSFLSVYDGNYQFLTAADAVVNSSGEPDPEPSEVTIAEAWEMNAGDSAIVSGVVVGLSNNALVIDDNTGTIYRYGSGAENLGFKVGDFVTISGDIDEHNDAKSFSADSKVTAATGTAPVLTNTEPATWTATELDAFTVAAPRSPLASIVGTVTSLGQYNNVSVDGASKTLSLFLPSTLSLEKDATYTFTGYVLYVSSERYVNMVVTGAESYALSAPTAIEITNTETSLYVNNSLQLNLAYTPSLSNHDVTWASSDDTTATVSPTGLVTGVKAGSVTITATSTADESVSDSIELTVTDAPAMTLAGTIDFSHITTKGGDAYDVTNMQESINTGLTSSSGLTVTVTDTSKVYPGNGNGGYFEKTSGIAKFGTGSENGVLNFTTSAPVIRIELDCAKWNDSASDTMTINGSTQDLPAYDGETLETLTYDFAETTSINITTAKRAFVKVIRLYTAA